MADIFNNLIGAVAAIFYVSEHEPALPVNAPNFPDDLDPVIRAETFAPGFSQSSDFRDKDDVDV
ncbi:hypothetical protein FJV76_13630 [Mesorhizobium sp. WSM4303]|uniref:hypothetical protein n=1 Tax=unclassified Mesorhizobium TaxID=325217 RepID=UPI00115D095C|nr:MULTISPECIES: hypothetical protein [unclassified Mesorhizobium]TRC98342.1 hypothetical protein FJV77_07740 [Mesorhizobium sp. WSM4306]TRD04320.1 hypothetical protein FJV76_13630 [Mesorhizobium sp. WSM4303]